MENKMPLCPVCRKYYSGPWWDHNSDQARKQDGLHLAFNAFLGAGVAALTHVVIRRIFQQK